METIETEKRATPKQLKPRKTVHCILVFSIFPSFTRKFCFIFHVLSFSIFNFRREHLSDERMHQRTLREVASWNWIHLIIVLNARDKCTTNNANYDEDDYEDDDDNEVEDDGDGDRSEPTSLSLLCLPSVLRGHYYSQLLYFLSGWWWSCNLGHYYSDFPFSCC